MEELRRANVHVYEKDGKLFANNHMYPGIQVDDLDAYFDYVGRLGDKLSSIGGTFYPEQFGPGPSHNYVEIEVTADNEQMVLAAVKEVENTGLINK